MNFDLNQNTFSKLSFLRYHVSKDFSIWSQITFDRHQNQLSSLCSMWCMYTPHMWYVQHSILEIPCLHFYYLTYVNLYQKQYVVLKPNIVHIRSKYEFCPSVPSWDVYNVLTFQPIMIKTTFDCLSKLYRFLIIKWCKYMLKWLRA